MLDATSDEPGQHERRLPLIWRYLEECARKNKHPKIPPLESRKLNASKRDLSPLMQWQGMQLQLALQSLLSGHTEERACEAEQLVHALEQIADLWGYLGKSEEFEQLVRDRPWVAIEVDSKLREWCVQFEECLATTPVPSPTFEQLLATMDKGWLEQIAAAFHLWPYHAARYYGKYCPQYAGKNDNTKRYARLASRRWLCAIQRLLFTNLRNTIAFLRISFGCDDVDEVPPYLEDRFRWNDGEKYYWRSRVLCDAEHRHPPDLCAVDSLAREILNLILQTHDIRQAQYHLHNAAFHSDVPKPDACNQIHNAFQNCHVAQLTVFYNSNPELAQPGGVLPLVEIVHEALALDKGDREDLDRLIPFHQRSQRQDWDFDEGRHGFRRLGHEIFSHANEGSFPTFAEQRRLSLGLTDSEPQVIRFVGEGLTTYQFLTTEPPKKASDTDNFRWYNADLGGIAGFPKDEIKDWKEDNWWTSINGDEFFAKLFPDGPSFRGETIHDNHHLSAFWDCLARENQELIDERPILLERVTGLSLDPAPKRFGHLMEILLRREEREARTSFVVRLAQTYEPRGTTDENQSRISQFVGGSFLGLERPGIPFEESRFHVIADFARPMLLALAHFCTTRAIKLKRSRAQIATKEFDGRKRRIVELLAGDAAPFLRSTEGVPSGLLPFARPQHGRWVREGIRDNLQTCFPYDPHLKSGLHWKASDITLEAALPDDCNETCKALFALTDESCLTLQNFLASDWKKVEGPTFRSYCQVCCADCLGGITRWLLGVELARQITISTSLDPPFYLPTRPGIRLILAVCDFIHCAHLQGPTKVTTMSYQDCKIGVTFSDHVFPSVVNEWNIRNIKPTKGNVRGSFARLKKCRAFFRSQSIWEKFLNGNGFGQTIQFFPKSRTLEILWSRMP